jgi:hypothetical protein
MLKIKPKRNNPLQPAPELVKTKHHPSARQGSAHLQCHLDIPGPCAARMVIFQKAWNWDPPTQQKVRASNTRNRGRFFSPKSVSTYFLLSFRTDSHVFLTSFHSCITNLATAPKVATPTAKVINTLSGLRPTPGKKLMDSSYLLGNISTLPTEIFTPSPKRQSTDHPQNYIGHSI